MKRVKSADYEAPSLPESAETERKEENVKYMEALKRLRGIKKAKIIDPKEKTRFKCLRICGAACCTFSQVVITPIDLVRIFRKRPEILIVFLYILLEDRRMVALLGKESKIPLILKPEEVPCPFLHYERGVATCIIYDVRPGECRSFPYGRIITEGDNGEQVVKAVVHENLCPPEAFRAGEERTIEEYWKEQQVVEYTKEEVEFLKKLSEITKRNIEGMEPTPEVKLFFVIRFIQSILASNGRYEDVLKIYEEAIKNKDVEGVIREARGFVRLISAAVEAEGQ